MNRQNSSFAVAAGAQRRSVARLPNQIARPAVLGAALIGFGALAIQALPLSVATATATLPHDAVALPSKAAAATPVDAFVEPFGATAELFASLARGEELDDLLERAGVNRKDAAHARSLVADALPAGIPEDTEVAILLGSGEGSSWRLERLSFKPSPAVKVTIGRTRAGALRLARDGLAVDARPRRFSGSVGGDLFWSLRAAGVPAQTASEFVRAVSQHIKLRQLARTDRFNLVIDHIRSENGESRGGPLLYAAIDRSDANDLTLVRWTVGGHTDLYDPTTTNQQTMGFARPVRGRVSSAFGHRIHPILGFARFHEGVDFSARWGTPVVAAADGRVAGAGWSGGYGRQVRLTHSGGVLTSYSHLSDIAVAPGTHVRRGDVIGFVGSSGLSTGPHLHFEVRKNGRPVDPMTFTSAPAVLDPVDMAALRARAEQLRGV